MEFKKIYFISAVLFCFACGAESPEDITRKFVELKASGECREAQKLTVGADVYGIQNAIDAGCQIYQANVVEVICENENDTAHCCCHEECSDGRLIHRPYDLRKANEEWKIYYYTWNEVYDYCRFDNSRK